MMIYLPAWKYSKLYLVEGELRPNGSCCRFELKAEQKTVKDLLGGVEKSPLKHNTYIVSVDLSYLFDKLCNSTDSCVLKKTLKSKQHGQLQRLNSLMCGYGVFKMGRNDRSKLWDTYGILLLSSCEKSRANEDGSSQFYVLVTKLSSAGSDDFKWLLLITDVDLRGCQCVELSVSLDRSRKVFHQSKEVLVERLDRLVTYPRLYVDEISYVSGQSADNVQNGTAVAEVAYIGSQIAVKGRWMQVFLPVLVRYDVEGVDPPRRIFPATRVYSIRIQLSVDDIYKLVKEVLVGRYCNWKAVVKVLSQNAVARSLRSLCEGYKGWIFEREISTEILDRNIIFTTPSFWKIKKLYNRIYLTAQRRYVCDSDSLKSLLMRWQDVVYEIKRKDVEKCEHAKNTAWIDYFLECLQKESYGSFRECVNEKVQKMGDHRRKRAVGDVIFSFFESFALWSLLLGAHGVAHIALKPLVKSLRVAEYAELIEVKLPEKYFQRAINNLHYRAQDGGAEIDGLFRIGKDGNERADVVIKVFDLKARSSLSPGDLQDSLKQQKTYSDKCDEAFKEEVSRLERAFQVLKNSVSDSSVLASLDSFMGKLPQEVAPPRFLFRFLISEIMQQIKQDQALQPRQFRLFQYVWPRYVHSCADGCYLCVLVPRHLCVYPPSQAEFKTSKTFALGLLERLLARHP